MSFLKVIHNLTEIISTGKQIRSVGYDFCHIMNTSDKEVDVALHVQLQIKFCNIWNSFAKIRDYVELEVQRFYTIN